MRIGETFRYNSASYRAIEFSDHDTVIGKLHPHTPGKPPVVRVSLSVVDPKFNAAPKPQTEKILEKPSLKNEPDFINKEDKHPTLGELLGDECSDDLKDAEVITVHREGDAFYEEKAQPFYRFKGIQEIYELEDKLVAHKLTKTGSSFPVKDK